MPLSRLLALLAILPVAALNLAMATDRGDLRVLLPEGLYTPFFKQNPGKGKTGTDALPVIVKAFSLDVMPVTKAQYRDHLHDHPKWTRSHIKPIFADENYLKDWHDDLDFGDPDEADEPVTNISWFAAEAYCEAYGATLPLTEQWEYALADQGSNQNALNLAFLDWFAKPSGGSVSRVGATKANGFGDKDLVGVVWEWTYDFDAFMTGTEQRNTDSKDNTAFCGAGSTGVADAANYPTFMRYAMRTSLKAHYTTQNIGFRCASDLK
jgi:formylglycine-generating enzyme required for sulfatase activity